MIKIYSTLLLSALTLTQCTQNNQTEVTPILNENMIFSVIFDEQTKGTPVDSEESMGSMGVFCAYTGDIYWSTQTTFDKMDNKRLDYNSELSKWVYNGDTPTWNNISTEEKYTFMAYSPYGNDSNGISAQIEDGDMVVRYTTPEDCSSQPDLMLATPIKDIYQQVGQSVALNYKHALASIGFRVQGVATQIVTEIAIKNVVSSGGVTISDDGDITWSLDATTDLSYSANIDKDIEPDIYTPQPLTLDDGYLMMIPQDCDDIEVMVTIYNTEYEDYITKKLSLSGVSSWQAGVQYIYTVNLSSYDYTIEGTANCYILHPGDTNQIFYIPVEGRINTFWRDYADDNQTYKDILSSSDEWEPTILWNDINGRTNNFSVERVTSGFSPSENVTPFSEPDFTTIGTRSAMKITLPADIKEGNVYIAVTLNNQILWSWHIWITSYNPDAIAANNTATQGQYIYTSSGVEGEVHRYDSEDLWSTLYNNRFIMDRNLGARDSDYSENRDGVLHYQFGRKDPFPASNSFSFDIVDATVPFYESVQNPTTFYVRKEKDYSWSEEGLTMSSSYLWFDKNVLNDPNASGKSIFDPSPLGWRVPRYGTFTLLNNNNCTYDSFSNTVLYNGSIKLPMTGYRSNYSGSVNDYGAQGNIRLSTQIDGSFAYNLVYNPDIDENTNNTLADGFCIRCIEE
ncbi:MAG: fimbrillin family protein [Rikenellaceae bacterium]